MLIVAVQERPTILNLALVTFLFLTLNEADLLCPAARLRELNNPLGSYT